MSSKRFGAKPKKEETEHEKKERKAAAKAAPDFNKGPQGKATPGSGAAKFFNRRTAG